MARKKIHQNFQAAKYAIKQHSDATEDKFILFTTFFNKQFIPTFENIRFVIHLRFI